MRVDRPGRRARMAGLRAPRLWLPAVLAGLLMVGSCVEELDITEGELSVPVRVSLVAERAPLLANTARSLSLHRLLLRIVNSETGEEWAVGEIDLDSDDFPASFQIRQDLPEGTVLPLEGTVELVHVQEGEEGEPFESVEWAAFLGPIEITTDEEEWVFEVPLGRGNLAEQSITALTVAGGEEPVVEGAVVSLAASVEGGPAGARIFWGTQDPELVSVDENGTVQTLLPGTARIVAAAGRHAEVREVLILQAVDSVEVLPSEQRLAALGEEAQFTARVLDPRGGEVVDRELAVTWRTENPNVAESLGGGLFQAVSFGEAEVVATVDGVEGRATLIVEREPGVIFEGDLTIFDAEDLAGFAAAGWEEVTGNLTIGGADSPLVNLDGMETLRRVGGLLDIRNNPSLENVSALAGLERVTDSFQVVNNQALASLPEFTGLVTSSLQIEQNPALVTMGGFPVLASASGISIDVNAALVAIPEFPALPSLSGWLSIGGNDSLETIGGFPLLQEVGSGHLRIITNPVLSEVPRFPALVSVGTYLMIHNNPEMATIGGFPDLQSVGTVLGISENGSLLGVPSFPGLEVVGWDLQLLSNSLLEGVAGFPALVSVGGELVILLNPALASVGDFPALTSVAGHLSFLGNGGLASLPGFPLLEEVLGTYRLSGNPLISGITGLPSLHTIGGNIEVTGNDALVDLGGLSGVLSTVQDIWIEGNASLTDIFGLQNVGGAEEAFPAVLGDFTVVNNPVLPQAGAEALAEALGVAGTVTISGNLEEGAPDIASIQVTPNVFHFLEVGGQQTFTATAYDADGQAIDGVEFTWSSSRPQVAAVDGAGLVTANGDGDAEITASAEGIDGTTAIRVTRNPEESLELAFLRWWWVTGNTDGPAPFLSTTAFQHSAWATNFGMVGYSQIPRQPILNDESALYYANFRNAWRWSYEALDHAARALGVLDEGLYPDVDATRARAYGRFLQGLAHGTLALLYDQAAIVDETVLGTIEEEVYWNTQAPHLLPLSPYPEVMAAALGYLQEAVALAAAGQFELPNAWLPATAMITDGDLARIARSYMARFRANLPRTPAEGDAVDWAAVLNDIQAGIQEDLVYQFNGSTFFHASFQFTHDPNGWSQLNNFVHGMADQNESYLAWMDAPVDDRTPFLIVTPDRRFPQGTTVEAQRDQAGTHFLHPTTYSHDQAARGTWRWSYYVSARNPADGIDGQVEDLTLDEMNLLAAEAHLRIGNTTAAVDLINQSRLAAGLRPTDENESNPDCVPLLPIGQCGNLIEMLKWEKRLMGVHNAGNHMASWYFDGRRWGDLLVGTFLHFPVPEEILIQRGMAVYTYGGVGGAGSAAGSMFDPPPP